MNTEILIKVDGEVEQPLTLTFDDLQAIDSLHQVEDVSSIAQRPGDAIRLDGLLELARAKTTAKYLGLHSSTDNFHASIPLEPVRQRALLIYRLQGQSLSINSGGPVRFFIPDHAGCHTAEIDECANVKFVDHIELTVEKGFDNRPEDDEEHERLHREQAGAGE